MDKNMELWCTEKTWVCLNIDFTTEPYRDSKRKRLDLGF